MKIQSPLLSSPAPGAAGAVGAKEANGGKDFKEMLGDAVSKVNGELHTASKAAEQLAAGEPVDIAQTMISITKAGLSSKLLLQVRNRAMGAYEEIMRLQF